MKKLIILLFTVFLSAGSLSAQSIDVKKLIQLANQGNVEAQYNLSGMYYNGRGVPQDYAEAVKWLRLPADQGFAEAQSILGAMYYNGEGVPQDYVQAHMWLNLAAAKGSKSGESNRNIVAGKMSPQQIAQAQELARNWKPKKK